MSPAVHSVNQGLQVKAGHGDFKTKEAPKEIGPIMVVTVMTSPTSQTSTGIEGGGVETVTDGTRIKQDPNNEKPTAKMTLDRMKRATAKIQHKG